jgi:hypothetical protein
VSEQDDLAFPPLREYKVEVEFGEVDPEVLSLLTGMEVKTVNGMTTFAKPDQPVHAAMEVRGFRKRTFWQWLFRRPRQPYTYYFPNVRIEGVSRNQ